GGITSIFIEGSLISEPVRFAIFLFGLFLTGGSANSLNQYFEREIDAKMSRTSSRRPLPLGTVTPRQALIFSIIIGFMGVIILAVEFNMLTAILSLATIFFYGFLYTLYLKPRTSQNIVIGGLAGAMAPVGAWTAATGSMALTPWLIFLIIFFWTPPHFWALAIHFQDDYRIAKLPMFPIVVGRKTTLDYMLLYSIIMFSFSIVLLIVNFGWFYMAIAILLGPVFIWKIVKIRKESDNESMFGLFKFSINYLFALFLALIIDKILWA
ncbi:MAG: heme o synthase, partial [Candidatus Zixiibacteriota bacterium]